MEAAKWSASWKRIVDGELLWKRNEQTELPLSTLHHALQFQAKPKLLVPLCGDAPIVRAAFEKGWPVAGIDLVEVPIRRLAEQIPGGVFTQVSDEVLTYTIPDSDALTLIVGDFFTAPPLVGPFDCVYDKDAFGAIPVDLRTSYVQRLRALVRAGAVVIVEVKNKGPGASSTEGPPFHFEPQTLTTLWTQNGFRLQQHWPEFYDVAGPEGFKQQAFMFTAI